jgi:hypothetical protein
MDVLDLMIFKSLFPTSSTGPKWGSGQAMVLSHFGKAECTKVLSGNTGYTLYNSALAVAEPWPALSICIALSILFICPLRR